VEVKEQYQVTISTMYADFINLDDDDLDIIRAWEDIRKNIKA
jgi:hypothetical protein